VYKLKNDLVFMKVIKEKDYKSDPELTMGNTTGV